MTPTASPAPTVLGPTTDAPAGYRRGTTVDFNISLVFDGLLLIGNSEDAAIHRWDVTTLEDLGAIEIGEPGVFPPDVSAVAPGTGGVWVNVASEHAVVLVDPHTGMTKRRVKIDGLVPYGMEEIDGALLIIDYEQEQLTRYDLAKDAVVATVDAKHPTDVLVAEGSIWLTQHVGRREKEEPLSYGGWIDRIDPDTNERIGVAKVGSRPGVLRSGFGGIWTGTFAGGSVDRVDPATNEVTSIFIGEDGAFDVEVIDDSVWATTGPQWDRHWDASSSYFVRIDPTTMQMRERVGFRCPLDIVPAPDGFWVSGECFDPPDGRGPQSTFFERIGSTAGVSANDQSRWYGPLRRRDRL